MQNQINQNQNQNQNQIQNQIQIEIKELRKNIIKINQNQINQNQNRFLHLHPKKNEIQDEKNNYEKQNIILHKFIS